MKINLDKSIQAIQKDLAIRGGFACTVAGLLDIATITFFYILIIGQLYYGEYGLALITFGVMTLWKVSMALQDITRAVHVLSVLGLIQVGGKRGSDE